MEKQKSSKNTPNQQTREKIVNALLTLIKEKPLSTITITELTQLAGVSRMAFYRNFSTKEEVFSSHLKDILQKYQEEDRKQNLQGIYYDRAHMIHASNIGTSTGTFLTVLSTAASAIFSWNTLPDTLSGNGKAPARMPASITGCPPLQVLCIMFISPGLTTDIRKRPNSSPRF